MMALRFGMRIAALAREAKARPATHRCLLVTQPDRPSFSAACSTISVYSPPPCGEALGVGVAVVRTHLAQQQLPPSPPLSHKGGGSTPRSGRRYALASADITPF